jgi:YrhK-like protein
MMPAPGVTPTVLSIDEGGQATMEGATELQPAPSPRSRSLVVPEGWTSVVAAGLGPFVTRETYRRPDGAVITWTSRQQGKRHSLLETGRGSTWWAPGAVGWWIGILFAVGSVCFAVGAAPGYVNAVGVAADGVTFFVGSLFFTVAAALTYLEVANASRLPPGVHAPERRRFLTWEPRRIDWWAALVQLAGTLLFNLSTFDAMSEHLSASEADRLVWTPDALGSICFLVASGLAWAEVSHAWWAWRPRSLSWLIAALNLAGSIAFGVSAIASHIVPASDQPRNVALMNLGTFVGAFCFLMGAVLLLPERTRDEARP